MTRPSGRTRSAFHVQRPRHPPGEGNAERTTDNAERRRRRRRPLRLRCRAPPCYGGSDAHAAHRRRRVGAGAQPLEGLRAARLRGAARDRHRRGPQGRGDDAGRRGAARPAPARRQRARPARRAGRRRSRPAGAHDDRLRLGGRRRRRHAARRARLRAEAARSGRGPSQGRARAAQRPPAARDLLLPRPRDLGRLDPRRVARPRNTCAPW